MARAIDANALHAEISKWPESVMYKDWVQSAIANAPTLTPPNEAIVHCADCANLMFSDYYGECKKCYLGGIIRPNDYCSRGIRREETHEQT